jgi:hypothetical protein
MQEIKKRRIVIASVLKPVDDTRMFEKMGISLASLYKVDIIGYPSAGAPAWPGIDFHPLTPFRRLSRQRFLAPFFILSKILRLKPDLLIVTTHELLWQALIAKMFTGTRVIYDVRENYRRNILHTTSFPFPLRPLLALWVTVKEKAAGLFIDHYLLAEAGYALELSFQHGHYTILENKFRKPVSVSSRSQGKHGRLRLIFSGTLALSTGIFTAIDLSTRLHQLLPQVHLTIIGYCAQENVLQKIRSAVEGKDFITLIGGDQLVPHAAIVKEIQESDFGIISYPFNPSTVNTIPTKLYEYLGCKLPILLVSHPAWVALAGKYDAAIVFEEVAPDVARIVSEIQQRNFYTAEPAGIFWEENTLLQTVERCLKRLILEGNLNK